MTDMIEILKLCTACITKPCATGFCPHGIESRADKIETMVMGLGYMPIELSVTAEAALLRDLGHII